ncbi:MAG: amidohydrolase, partial [Sutterella wadsworthensis]|nr:amidohydrolase [Sutterella wadsworthensis]
MQPILADKAFPELVQWADELAALRRDIHAHPELGFETPRTVDLIVKTLKGWGLEHVDPDEVKGGVVVVINGAAPGATVALRADIDALPMPDNSANPWKSQTEMRCHACGHDGHAAWLLGALRYLHEKRASFKGRVVGIFQPAEEIGRGALRVVQSGVFEHWGIQEIYGAHDEPTVAKGQYGLCAGPAQASTDFFYITVKGRGVHAARPHLGVDPITTAGVLIGALQTIVSRKVNPIETAVLSISSVNGGNF